MQKCGIFVPTLMLYILRPIKLRHLRPQSQLMTSTEPGQCHLRLTKSSQLLQTSPVLICKKIHYLTQ